MSTAVTFAAVFAAVYAAHMVADHWVQTDHQARTKGAPGWAGRLSCAVHVATYTLTAVVAVAAVAWRCGLDLDPARVTVALLVSAVSHYIADRRTPLLWLAVRTGSARFVALGAPRAGRDDNPCLGTGAYALDQSWHVGWLAVAALIAA
ncbi:hypothetical protein GCM10010124_00120 [Pilimelia terevasa]|uniref:DUF3307 domain-containing protein n=1 Tax=Pilimelia terevasa TaxID=53372 RepID=A0A8J3BCL4_9ACTN|nr:DUF3307 domain-containing protein [Pilimelia terevasa]GGK11463.1 hypothetical protein GCM10010124_00120 [Pilimelia terevasa]